MVTSAFITGHPIENDYAVGFNGILTQKPPNSILDQLEDKNYTSFVAASYVKHVESGGARVVPIFINQEDAYYEYIGNSVNGIVFPGGATSITNSSGYGAAGRKLYDIVLRKNAEGISLPLWGTCLGFEMITYLAANNTKWLAGCAASNRADRLTLQPGYMDSRIFTQMPDYVIDYATLFNTTVNFHKWCITPENFTLSGLSNEFKMLTTSFDDNALEYISLIEHETLPIFGSQFHPEKNPYEWPNDENHNAIPHDPFAIGVAHFFSNFFTNQARLNTQKFPTEQEEQAALIYNHDRMFSGELGSPFMESYLFR
ncbi:hypothetical protein SK128_004358 [Halocaridina rubra]|uniref:folate gamma-glutamyl hydrolase n=1 Tax=Halocaridina rubra TaxID=373956 RepID=A0AAN8X5X7_HALRR